MNNTKNIIPEKQPYINNKYYKLPINVQKKNIDKFGDVQLTKYIDKLGANVQLTKNIDKLGVNVQLTKNIDKFGDVQKNKNIDKLGANVQLTKNIGKFGDVQKNKNIDKLGDVQKNKNIGKFGDVQKNKNIGKFGDVQKNKNIGKFGDVQKKNLNYGLKGDMDGLGKEKGINMNPRFVYLYKKQFEMEATLNKNDMNGISPLSGYEPDYNPNYWNNNKNIKNNNNCYSYSVNNKNHQFGKPQPGYFARFNHIKDNQYKCVSFFKRILNDIPSVYLTSFKQKCKKGFSKAFFAIDSNKNEHDYHFYRQDNNKLWSHKPGTTNVINYDADYKIIKNPYTANRNYSAYNYDKPCFFFCVNNKFGKTKANI
jgi:hypothetical protein